MAEISNLTENRFLQRVVITFDSAGKAIYCEASFLDQVKKEGADYMQKLGEPENVPFTTEISYNSITKILSITDLKLEN